ncbi:MAG: glycosyltransferase [Bacteroidota bacterium]|nr:glycosyltransferase [Bacteroidota bacterium]
MKNSGNILILTYWSYHDALIQTYTLPYVRLISKHAADQKIILLTLDKEEISQIPPEGNIEFLSLSYIPFGAKAGIKWISYLLKLRKLIADKKITTIHCWCTPAGMIGYLLSKITGCRLIIDSYEPHAEAMVENGEWKRNSAAFRILYYFEKLQTHNASYLIATTEGMKEYAAKTFGYKGLNFFTKPACVDLQLFSDLNIKKDELLDRLNLRD